MELLHDSSTGRLSVAGQRTSVQRVRTTRARSIRSTVLFLGTLAACQSSPSGDNQPEMVTMSEFEGCVGFVRNATIDEIPPLEIITTFDWLDPVDSPLRHPLRGTVDIQIAIEPDGTGLRYLESKQCAQQSCPGECVSRHEANARVVVSTSDGMLDEEFYQWVGLTDRGLTLVAVELDSLQALDGDLANVAVSADPPWSTYNFALQVERSSNGIAVGRLLARLSDDGGQLGLTAMGILSPQ